MARQTVPDQPKEMKGIWKPTAADSKREGEYIRIEPPKAGKEKFGESYILLEPSGQELSLPNHVVLQNKMKTLKTGWYVWVSFIGKDNKTLLYNVEYDNEYKKQAKLDEPIDAAGKILKAVSCSTCGLSDVEFWKHLAYLPLAESSALVSYLKAQGKLIQDANGTWRTT